MYLDELLAKVPEFKRAWYEKGLSVNEYEHFGPVEYFRHIFVDAWEKSLKVISETRNNQVKN
jgi:hypothetical protein